LLIPKVIVPAMPGEFSALGMLVAELRHDYVQTYLRDMKKADMGVVLTHFRDIERQARATLVSEGAELDTVSSVLKLDLRYQGQDHVLSVPASFEELEKGERQVFVDRYDRAHMDSYGHAAPGEVVEIVNLRLVATGRASRDRIEVFQPIAPQKAEPQAARRRVHWGGRSGWLDTAIYQRGQLGAGFRCRGPAIVEEWASTTCIFPGDTMLVDALGNLVVEVH
jgi:N-methylhydantoinase A